MSLPKDAAVAIHVHDFDHLSILAKGRVVIFTDEKRTEHEAGDWIEMKSGARHGIVALEDAVWFCINVDS